MSAGVSYDLVDRILTVRITGQRPSNEPEAVADAVERWAEIARRARQPDVVGIRVLVELVGAHSSQRAQAVAKSVGALGLPRGIPIALVNEDRQSFGQTNFGARLAASRGWLSKAFGEAALADEWLRSGLTNQIRSVSQPLSFHASRLRIVVHDLIHESRVQSIADAETLQTIAHVIAMQLGCRRVCIWRLDGEPGHLALTLVAGADADLWALPMQPPVRLGVADDYISSVQRTGCEVCEDATRADPANADPACSFGAPGFRARLVAPIVDPATEGVAGLISCLESAPAKWPAAEVAQVRLCAMEMSALLASGKQGPSSA